MTVNSGLVVISRTSLRLTECLRSLIKAQNEAAAGTGQGLKSERLFFLQKTPTLVPQGLESFIPFKEFPKEKVREITIERGSNCEIGD